MRYISVAEVKNGMALGQDIFDGEGRMLLTKHQILNEQYIEKLETLGFHGIYIDDEFSEDIQIEQILKPELRSRALSVIHALFTSGEDEEDIGESELRQLVIDVVEDVLNHGDVMYHMMDIKSYDDYTFYHSVNVAVLSIVLGARYGMQEYELRIIATSALLHDIGKKFLEEDILIARRPLIDAERRIMLQHPKLGYEFLKDTYDLEPDIYTAVLEHHENYNGEGYPMRKSGEEISIYARIIRLADAYDAMVSKRPYRDAELPGDAVEYLMSMCGIDFDPELVELFVKWVAVYPVGCTVSFSDGREGIVVKNFPNFALRPMIKIIDTGDYINLKEDQDARNITIVKLRM